MNVKRLLAPVVAAVTLATVGLVSAPAQAATPPVMIKKVYVDSPGSDTGSNGSLNAEYVWLTNTTNKAVNLQRWTLRDKANHVYTFPSLVVGAGKSVLLRSGKGSNTTATVFWQQSWYVWNNAGDTAYLRTPSGALMDSCSWNKVVSKAC